MKTGRIIKQIRLQRNYSQAWMAERLGISQRAFSKLENDEVTISVEKLQCIAELLETSVVNFFNPVWHFGQNVSMTDNSQPGLPYTYYRLFEKQVQQDEVRILDLEKQLKSLTERIETLEKKRPD